MGGRSAHSRDSGENHSMCRPRAGPHLFGPPDDGRRGGGGGSGERIAGILRPLAAALKVALFRQHSRRLPSVGCAGGRPTRWLAASEGGGSGSGGERCRFGGEIIGHRQTGASRKLELPASRRSSGSNNNNNYNYNYNKWPTRNLKRMMID